MSIRLTDELKAQALEVARQYEPLATPLLVGSCLADKIYRVATCEKLRELGENQCPFA